ncbi:MAG: DnaJ domain-containing protein [Cyanobacteria bacterium]|nr:DnaJ domain-containing protein [Cyanobacteriota bacterium]
MAGLKNYYLVLQLEPFVGLDEVKAAYRKLARQYHPDVNPGNPEAEDRFKQINEAYEILGSADKKAMYDQSLQRLMDPNRAKQKHPDSPPGKPTQSATPPPSPSSTPGASAASTSASAKSAYKQSAGTSEPKPETQSIHEFVDSFLKKPKTGPAKKAQEKSASSERASDWKKEARAANHEPKQETGAAGNIFHGQQVNRRGEDVTVETQVLPQEAEHGVVKTVNVQHNEICKRCSGTGKLNGAVCQQCVGEKILIKLKKIDVRIPGGVKNGSKVRVAGEGGRGYGGGESGDLFLVIKISVDSSLRVEGQHVYSELMLQVHTLVLGAEINVPTINGPVSMTIPPSTPVGKTFRLKEMGVQTTAGKGDHFVTVQVQLPQTFSGKEQELYRELRKLHPDPLVS